MLFYIINPTYNEADNIANLIQENYKVLSESNIFEKHQFVNLVVDDNSPDGTSEIVKKVSQKYSFKNFEVKLLKRSKKDGLSSAYIEGFKLAIDNSADFVIQMDSDFSHQPKFLIDFIKLSENYDLVIGSRYIKNGKVENWSMSRKLLSKLGNIYAKTLLNVKVHDCTTGFNLYSRILLEKILKHGISMKGYGFLIEMKYLAVKIFKANWIESSIIFPDRKFGKSKMNGKIAKEAMFSIWKLRKIK